MDRAAILLTSVLFCCVEGFTQSPAHNVFWVVETNIRHPNYTIVHFYNTRNVKVHEVKLQGVYLDITNPKHKKKLDLLTKQFNDRTITSSKRRKAKNPV